MLRTFATMTRLTAVLCCTLLLSVGCSDDDNGGPTNPIPSGDVEEKIGPILFVHGENESAEVWNIMAKWFLNNGYTEDQLYAVDLMRYKDSGTPDASVMAAQIKEEMDAIVSATGEGRVDIIAHGAGVTGVQYYLTQLAGTERAAHVVWIGGQIDDNLRLGGSLTPAPCEYMTVTSDGSDATQGGNASNGTIPNVTNVQVPGADHQQLCISSTAYSKIQEFFTADAPMHTDLPTASIGSQHKVSGRVLSFIDNEPIEGATITIIYVTFSNDIFGPQSPAVAGPVDTDADGRFEIASLTNVSEMEVRIQGANGYYDSRVYRQPFLKGPVMFDRYYMIPEAGGSLPLQNLRGAFTYTADHSNVIVHTVNHALHSGRDSLKALFLVRGKNPDFPDSLRFENPSLIPAAGSGGMISNVTNVCLFDANTNQQNDSGPVGLSGVEGFSMTSYDLYFWATARGKTSGVKVNKKRLHFQNYRSGGTDDDFIWLKFTDLE